MKILKSAEIYMLNGKEYLISPVPKYFVIGHRSFEYKGFEVIECGLLSLPLYIFLSSVSRAYYGALRILIRLHLLNTKPGNVMSIKDFNFKPWNKK